MERPDRISGSIDDWLVWFESESTRGASANADADAADRNLLNQFGAQPPASDVSASVRKTIHEELAGFAPENVDLKDVIAANVATHVGSRWRLLATMDVFVGVVATIGLAVVVVERTDVLKTNTTAEVAKAFSQTPEFVSIPLQEGGAAWQLDPVVSPAPVEPMRPSMAASESTSLSARVEPSTDIARVEPRTDEVVALPTPGLVESAASHLSHSPHCPAELLPR